MERKEVAWKDGLIVREMIVKEGYMAIKDEKGTVMRCSYQSKKDANELLGRMMNQDISWKIKLFSIDVKMLEGKDRGKWRQ